MINIMWVIVPWVAIIIFAVGWHLGSRRSVFRVRYECRKEQEHEKQIDDIHREIANSDKTWHNRLRDSEEFLTKKIYEIDETVRSLDEKINKEEK